MIEVPALLFYLMAGLSGWAVMDIVLLLGRLFEK